jgi:hypothetical protein
MLRVSIKTKVAGFRAAVSNKNYTETARREGIKRPCNNPTLLRVGSLLPSASSISAF